MSQTTCCLQLIEFGSLLQEVVLIVERVNDVLKVPHLNSYSLHREEDSTVQ